MLPSPRKLRSERCGAYKAGIQENVVKRVTSAVNMAKKDCDKFAVLAFDEMTIKGAVLLQHSIALEIFNCFGFYVKVVLLINTC